MATYEIRNRRTRMVLGEVVADQPEDVLNAWMAESGMTLEDAVGAFGGTMESVRATLDIAKVEPRGPALLRHVASAPLRRRLPHRRRLYCEGAD